MDCGRIEFVLPAFFFFFRSFLVSRQDRAYQDCRGILVRAESSLLKLEVDIDAASLHVFPAWMFMAMLIRR